MAQKTAWDGIVLTETDINTYLAGEGGAWSAWTPAVTQSGSVTVTNTRSQYARYGRTIHFQCDLSVTGSGTGTNGITVSLPVTAAASSGIYIGVGVLFDTSTSTAFPAIAGLASSSTMLLLSTSIDSSGGGLGAVGFTAGLASGDTIRISGTYEAAS